MIKMTPIGNHVEKIQKWNPLKDLKDEYFDYIDLTSIDKDAKIIDSSLVQRINGKDAPSRARQLIKNNDVLVSTVRPNLNGVAILSDTYQNPTASTGYCVLRAKSSLCPKYLFYWVRTNMFISEMIEKSTGASYPAVSDKIIKETEIPLPPLQEQKKIAEILDAAAALKQKSQEVLDKYDELAQSIFLEMFGDPVTNPKGWDVLDLKSLTVKIGSGATPRGGKESYLESGISLVRSLNIHDNEFKLKDLAFIDEKQAKRLKNVTLEPDDVLINITGASVARCTIIPSNILPARVNQHVSILRPVKNKLNSVFLLHLLISKNCKLKLLGVGSSNAATRESITKSQLEDFEIPLPPFDIQDQFAYHIKNIEQQKAMGQESLQQADNLFNALLQKAFKGELV